MKTPIFHEMKYDLNDRTRPLLCYREFASCHFTLRSFDLFTTLTYVLMDNFFPCGKQYCKALGHLYYYNVQIYIFLYQKYKHSYFEIPINLIFCGGSLSSNCKVNNLLFQCSAFKQKLQKNNEFNYFSRDVFVYRILYISHMQII